MTENDYDGFHFLPHPENEGEFFFQFFSLKNTDGSTKGTEPIGKTEVGEMYNVLLMKDTEDEVILDDVFQAIFADPTVYAEGLIGSNIFGTFVKHTEHAKEWWRDYVSTTKKLIDEMNVEEKQHEKSGSE